MGEAGGGGGGAGGNSCGGGGGSKTVNCSVRLSPESPAPVATALVSAVLLASESSTELPSTWPGTVTVTSTESAVRSSETRAALDDRALEARRSVTLGSALGVAASGSLYDRKISKLTAVLSLRRRRACCSMTEHEVTFAHATASSSARALPMLATSSKESVTARRSEMTASIVALSPEATEARTAANADWARPEAVTCKHAVAGAWKAVCACGASRENELNRTELFWKASGERGREEAMGTDVSNWSESEQLVRITDVRVGAAAYVRSLQRILVQAHADDDRESEWRIQRWRRGRWRSRRRCRWRWGQWWKHGRRWGWCGWW